MNIVGMVYFHICGHQYHKSNDTDKHHSGTMPIFIHCFIQLSYSVYCCQGCEAFLCFIPSFTIGNLDMKKILYTDLTIQITEISSNGFYCPWKALTQLQNHLTFLFVGAHLSSVCQMSQRLNFLGRKLQTKLT